MTTPETRQDFFISHATADKEQYIEPLVLDLTQRGITYWLDSTEMAWGDQLAMKINEGLSRSRYVLLCLSSEFLKRPWPETEMNTALAIQNDQGIKKVLPLILNSKDLVLNTYPIISGLIYREFDEGIDTIGDALAGLSKKSEIPDGHIRVEVESVHTGQLSNIVISPRVSIAWLLEKVRRGADLKEKMDTGGFESFNIRWVLVDARAEPYWDALPRSGKRRVCAIVKSDDDFEISVRSTDRLADIGVYDGIVFHLCAVENVRVSLPKYKKAWRRRL